MNEKEKNILYIDSDYQPMISESEGKQLQNLMVEFQNAYVKNKDKSINEWLEPKLQEFLPEKSGKEIHNITKDIISTLETNQKNRDSLEKATAQGRSKESWFASFVKSAASAVSVSKSAEYLTNLDKALENANEALYNTITTKAGTVSQNPHLDGFIAEQYHAQTFNLNAEAAGSKYRAKVLEPEGTGYTKNSVDIVIVDESGKVVNRYQSKYCNDSKATEKAFKKGDYRGQQKLVPEDQQADISKKSTDVLEAPDGTTSNPLTKSQAEKMKDEAQSGKWNDLNWNEYAMKDLAIGISKQAGYAALQGAAIGAGFELAQKLWNKEDIDAEEIVGNALKTGADVGLKAAVAGALKVAAEKGIISVIPKGTPASTIANVVYVAVENVKVISKIASGELSFYEGAEELERTTVSVVAGLVAMASGTELGVMAGKTVGTVIGKTVGIVLGPVGVTIGGFIGGTVGFMAGSLVGGNCVKGVQSIREKILSSGKKAVNFVKETVTEKVSVFCNGLKSVLPGV